MAILATQDLVGSVGRVYDLRTVGKDNLEVIDFTVAVTPRKKVDGEWTDGETYWSTITAWGKLAKNIEASLKPGDRVMLKGRTEMKDGYTNKEGIEVPARPIIVADFVAIELSYNPAHSDRPAKGERGSYSGGGSNSRNESSSSSSSSSSSRQETKKAAPKDDDLDLFGDDGDDDDFTPF